MIRWLDGPTRAYPRRQGRFGLHPLVQDVV
jgi:hypothetical protein